EKGIGEPFPGRELPRSASSRPAVPKRSAFPHAQRCRGCGLARCADRASPTKRPARAASRLTAETVNPKKLLSQRAVEFLSTYSGIARDRKRKFSVRRYKHFDGARPATCRCTAA